jgi:lipoprotein-anchoring transpeptidase ErfK/SrfK
MTRARIARAILAILLLLGAAPAAASAKAFPLPGPTVVEPLDALVSPGDTMKLSDERKITRWAHANTKSLIRTAPATTAPTITRLRYETEDKLPEVYLVLSAIVDAGGEVWLRIRIPIRPNGRTGWVPVDMLSQLYRVRTRLVINRAILRATLYKNGSRIWQAPVGVGKAATPTPKGNFYVRERLKGDGKVYGTWAFGTSAYANISDWPKGGVVGIHGTNQPKLVPGRPSHGCVRVRNTKINLLARLMPIGTPIQIIG